MLSLRATTCLSILVTTLLLSPTQAATLRWPGPSAPCAASLQACIDGAADGDTILVTDAAFPITGTISIAKSLTLSSDEGARARFENAILSITATRAGGQVTRLRKLHLQNSQVSTILGNSNAADVFEVSLSELRISAPATQPAIGISPIGTGSDNRVSITHARLSGRQLIEVPGGLFDERLSVSVRNSTLQISPTTVGGMSWSFMDGGSRLDFIGNRCEGLKRDSAHCLAVSTENTLTGSGPALVNVDRNVFVGTQRGVEMRIGAVALTTRVRNNSFSELNSSLVFLAPGSGLADARVGNNVFAKVDNAVVIPATGLPNLVRSRNLYWQLTNPPFLAHEANAVIGNPGFVGPYDLRPQQSSATRDSADPAELAPFQPDHDGLVGLRASAFDIGAFEWNDAATFPFRSGPDNIVSNTVALPQLFLDATLGDMGFVQRTMPDDSPILPADSNRHLGLYRVGSRFELFAQDLGTFPSADLFVFRPGAGTFARDPVFIHRAVISGDSSNNVVENMTILDNSQFPAGIGPLTSVTPLVFQRWDPPGSGGTYNNHAIGMYHSGGTWRVFNQDQAGMPHGAGFHVLVPSPFADYVFKVRSPVARAELVLDHPRLNDNPCTQVLVNAAFGDPLDPGFGAAYVPSELIVAYKDLGDGAGEWIARRGDGLNFPPSTILHAYVDPRSSRHCLEERPFSDGFE